MFVLIGLDQGVVFVSWEVIISGFGLNLLLGRLDFRMSCDLARVSSDGSVWE